MSAYKEALKQTEFMVRKAIEAQIAFDFLMEVMGNVTEHGKADSKGEHEENRAASGVQA